MEGISEQNGETRESGVGPSAELPSPPADESRRHGYSTLKKGKRTHEEEDGAAEDDGGEALTEEREAPSPVIGHVARSEGDGGSRD